jgi:hypothetical protein
MTTPCDLSDLERPFSVLEHPFPVLERPILN